MSEARPLPSHTTTGTGGVSLRYSRTIEITLGPPSTIRATTGTPCPIPVDTEGKKDRNVRDMGICVRLWGGFKKEERSQRLKVKCVYLLLEESAEKTYMFEMTRG